MRKTSAKPQHKGYHRKQASRRKREARAKRWLTIGTGATLGLVVVILGWGLYQQYVLRPRQPVATVSGQRITLKAYQDLVRYRRWYYGNYLSRLEEQSQALLASEEDQTSLIQYVDQQISQLKRELTNVSTSVLDEMIDDQLVRQECSKREISVTPEQVQLRLEAQFGYVRETPASTPITATLPLTTTATPTMEPMTEEQFAAQSAAWFQTMRKETGCSESEYRRLLESALCREKLEESIKAEVPTTADQVHARHILLKTREEAEAALTRLRNGEDFKELAGKLSQDEATKEKGGDLGWFPRGQMVSAFSDAAFALQPGEVSEVVETDFGYHIIRVDEREANRELDATARWQAEQKATSDWLAAQRASQDIVRSWDSTMVPME